MLMFGCKGLRELGSEENENEKMGQTSSPFTRSFDYYVNTIND